MAIGVSLAFGVMNIINLAHGSMLMLGAYFIAAAAARTPSFLLALLMAMLGIAILAPLLAVQSGMGDPLLILALAVVVIGGVGSLKGALVAAIAVGLIDTYGRMFWPQLLGNVAGNIMANAAVYVLMAVVIAWRPSGLFGRAH